MIYQDKDARNQFQMDCIFCPLAEEHLRLKNAIISTSATALLGFSSPIVRRHEAIGVGAATRTEKNQRVLQITAAVDYR